MAYKNSVTHLPLFSSGHYYSKKDFDFEIATINRTVTNTTVLRHNDGITLIYFKSGNGTIIVNSVPYPIKKGMMICLGSYHYFQISSSGEPIELAQCRLSYDTFLYMSANPYYDFSEITLNIKPLTSLLEGHMLERTNIVIDELTERTAKKKSRKNSNFDNRQNGGTEFFLCMRLMGLLQKTHKPNL